MYEHTCTKKIYYLNYPCFYHAVPCRKINYPEQDVIENLQENARANQSGNWANSMYLSFKEEVSKGYIVAKEKDGNLIADEYYLIKLCLKSDLNYISCTDEKFAAGTEADYIMPAAELENIAKIIGSENEKGEPFMTYLGNAGYAFECYHDLDGNKEFIVPSQLITKDYFHVFKMEKWKVDNYGKLSSAEIVIKE